MLGVTKFCGTTLVQKGAVWVTEDIEFFKHSLVILFIQILVLVFLFIDIDVFISEGQLAVTLWEMED